ncbi:hypothetical protein FA13DRAFT_1731651 [Coprinellus micaceus]|uniref:Uncharacterized protein n=1 Tax=Coprinellus micaceus TaxID=71717 RepID=A0A4Y7TFW4_COPMI|nr:hypothetical protein FA13DRAFT_1731651 [Coprinellus micaceus]
MAVFGASSAATHFEHVCFKLGRLIGPPPHPLTMQGSFQACAFPKASFCRRRMEGGAEAVHAHLASTHIGVNERSKQAARQSLPS